MGRHLKKELHATKISPCCQSTSTYSFCIDILQHFTYAYFEQKRNASGDIMTMKKKSLTLIFLLKIKKAVNNIRFPKKATHSIMLEL